MTEWCHKHESPIRLRRCTVIRRGFPCHLCAVEQWPADNVHRFTRGGRFDRVKHDDDVEAYLAASDRYRNDPDEANAPDPAVTSEWLPRVWIDEHLAATSRHGHNPFWDDEAPVVWFRRIDAHFELAASTRLADMLRSEVAR